MVIDLRYVICFTSAVMALVSCSHSGGGYSNNYVRNDSILIKVKPFYPAENEKELTSENLELLEDHFLVRIEKKNSFSPIQSKYLTDAVKNDFRLEVNGVERSPRLFIYEALFPVDNIVQFMLVYDSPGEREFNYRIMHVKSKLLGFNDSPINFSN